jgi:hypothetical protein
LSQKKKEELSIICISTVARNRDMMNLIQNCSFFYFFILKKGNLVTEYYVFPKNFGNSAKFGEKNTHIFKRLGIYCYIFMGILAGEITL